MNDIERKINRCEKIYIFLDLYSIKDTFNNWILIPKDEKLKHSSKPL